MKASRFLILTICIGTGLALLIYWREHEVRGLVAPYRVVLWQLAIWAPWILGYKFLERIARLSSKPGYRFVLLFVSSLIWLGLHFAWFFTFSAHYSPYLDFPGTRFGVFRYFFVFWTAMDIGLLFFVLDKLRPAEKEKKTILFELTRGGNKYFCEPSQIYLLTSENYYTRLTTSEGTFLMRKPLKSYEALLPKDGFLRIHRSAIVNVEQVAELARGSGHSLEVVMKDGSRRKVSRNLAGEINRFFRDRAL
jgi:hypothetical protein